MRINHQSIREFFYDNQQLLLKLVNTSAGKHLLEIKDTDPIVKITPHAIHILKNVYEDRIELQMIAKTYAHFSKLLEPIITKMEIANEEKHIDNLYNAFLHYAGYQRGLYPQIYLTTTTFADENPGGGRILDQNRPSFATARSDASGTLLGNDNSSSIFVDTSWRIDRNFMPFVTGSLTSSANITNGVVQMYRDDVFTGGFSDPDSDSIYIVPNTQANLTSLALSDYSSISYVDKGHITAASTVNGQYNNITLSDLTVINKTADTPLSAISGRDFNNTAPTGKDCSLGSGASHSPQIIITYTLPTLPKTININQAINRASRW